MESAIGISIPADAAAEFATSSVLEITRPHTSRNSAQVALCGGKEKPLPEFHRRWWLGWLVHLAFGASSSRQGKSHSKLVFTMFN
ncbi:MAG: hypothetical protein NTV08_00735 [Verrucomicrobia bacterium]|nr:hypothetical protein [Verrucomicrobiota bacterium]